MECRGIRSCPLLLPAESDCVMDQKRLFIAIALSLAILLTFQFILPKKPTPVTDALSTKTTLVQNAPRPNFDVATPGTEPMAVPEPKDTPRLKIAAPRVQGSINLRGARLDDLVLKEYHEEVDKASPLVRLLEPRSDPQPYYVEFGWVGTAGLKVPADDTVWTANGEELTEHNPVTLSWNNGAGTVFEIVFSVDDYYMFTAEQRIRNTTGVTVSAYPFSRLHRDYKPQTAGYYILHEGPVGVLNGRLEDSQSYDDVKKGAEKKRDATHDSAENASLEITTTGGWAGITDKYWLAALIPDPTTPVDAAYRYVPRNNTERYQVDFVTKAPVTAAPGETAALTTRLFAGAKVVQTLDRYEEQYKILHFDKAVDFGYFYYITKPIFYALDWLYNLTGNFGIAILIFTVFAKLAFFPLANKAYRSMSKMKALGPKQAELRERFKDDPQKIQSEIMALYKSEKVNPAGGCLPMVVQIPVFFSLYKVIFVTIEMRHAPFFGWIHDLSVVDPTNVFNLFGLIPIDPGQFSHLLHLGVWPLIMGVTMFLQQKLNPPPPDPVQAKIFQFMPIIFTFMMSSFPAGLVIYWSWNNLLTIAQQWTIMRRTPTSNTQLVRT